MAYTWSSTDDYPGISYMNNLQPGEMYIVGGEYPTMADPNMAGPFVAKVEPPPARKSGAPASTT